MVIPRVHGGGLPDAVGVLVEYCDCFAGPEIRAALGGRRDEIEGHVGFAFSESERSDSVTGPGGPIGRC